jgi:hypothetical protein
LFSPLFWQAVLDFRLMSDSQLEVELSYFFKDLEMHLGGLVLLMISETELKVTITHFNRYQKIFVQGVKFQPGDNTHIIKISKYPITLNINMVQFKVRI